MANLIKQEGVKRLHLFFLGFVLLAGFSSFIILKTQLGSRPFYSKIPDGAVAPSVQRVAHEPFGQGSASNNGNVISEPEIVPVELKVEPAKEPIEEKIIPAKPTLAGKVAGTTAYNSLNKTKKGSLEQEGNPSKRQLNVALFYADDWTMKVLGKLDKYVKTPNIDKMADNGMIFTNNCVTTSVCWASRSTLATGVYTSIHQHFMPFDEAVFETNHWNQTLYTLMKNNNYYTGLMGKWHKLEEEDELQAAFHKRTLYYGQHYEERDDEMVHVTTLNERDSVNFLHHWGLAQDNRAAQKKTKLPFFLTTSFFATHAQDGNPISYDPTPLVLNSTYPDSLKIPRPKTATKEHYKRLPPFLRHDGNEGRTRWKNRFDPKSFQHNIKDMYAMATEVDAAVGAIVRRIEEMGELDNTLLIFTTDNGNMHGEHGLAEKWYPFEESLRVPLVIQDPRMPKDRRGTTSEAWTLNVDLAPTILAAAEIPLSPFMQGRDIADLYLNRDEGHAGLSNAKLKEAVDWRKDWFYEFNLGKELDGSGHVWKNFIDASFALVNDEWKYVIWPQHNYEQLFHRSVDPYEEWDLLDKILRSKENANTTDTANGPFKDTVQTTEKMYVEMKERFNVLKAKAQSGERI